MEITSRDLTSLPQKPGRTAKSEQSGATVPLLHAIVLILQDINLLFRSLSGDDRPSAFVALGVSGMLPGPTGHRTLDYRRRFGY